MSTTRGAVQASAVVASRPTGRAGRPTRRAGTTAALVVMVLAAVGSLSACGAKQSPASVRAASQFVTDVHQQSPDVSKYKTDSELLRLGGAACDGFRSGASTVQVADRLELAETSPLLPSEDFGAVLSSAVADLCPTYHDRLSPLGPG